MATPLRVLILDDRAEDAELLIHELRRAGFTPDWQRVETEAEFVAHLRADVDIILADYSMPLFGIPRALDLLREHGLDIPLIVVTGTVTEQVINETLQQGAVDYLLKDRLARLGQAITFALEQKRLRDEKQKADQELHESEARFRRITENAADVIYRYRVTPTHGFEYVNPAMTTITGYTPAECYANPGLLFNLIHEDDEWLLQRLIDAGQDLTRSVDIRWMHKNGTVIWTEQRNVLLYDEMGHLVAIEGVVRDISERKRVMEAHLKAELLRAELEKEKEVSDLKERFISMASHEFRTPLTVIRMSSELMANFPERFPPERQHKFLHDILAQVKYMVELIDDVLTISKARAGKIEFHPAPLDVEGFCRSILEQFQLVNEKGFRLVFRSTGQFANALMDETLLRHILVNLLSNAIKYSPQGGEVSLEVDQQGEEVVFRIRDQGIGIPLADQERLFEPFHRAKNAVKISGTGLGLTIVKSNVETHRGTISCQSAEGKGTTFIVRLPLTSNQRHSSA